MISPIRMFRRPCPYGIYDIGENKCWVNVGMSGDTAEFAVQSIRQWWRRMGRPRYPRARRLLICADSGGSNGYRLQLWKRELQTFATEEKLTINVCHFPPGTSKWNKIEHRLFSFISANWRGRPLSDYRTIVSLIAGTTTTTGLTVKCRLDRRTYFHKPLRALFARFRGLCPFLFLATRRRRCRGVFRQQVVERLTQIDRLRNASVLTESLQFRECFWTVIGDDSDLLAHFLRRHHWHQLTYVVHKNSVRLRLLRRRAELSRDCGPTKPLTTTHPIKESASWLRLMLAGRGGPFLEKKQPRTGSNLRHTNTWMPRWAA